MLTSSAQCAVGRPGACGLVTKDFTDDCKYYNSLRGPAEADTSAGTATTHITAVAGVNHAQMGSTMPASRVSMRATPP